MVKILKKRKKVTKALQKKTKGRITITPVSFHMDKTIDKYVVRGGGYNTHVAGSKSSALTVARARERIIKKRKQ